MLTAFHLSPHCYLRGLGGSTQSNDCDSRIALDEKSGQSACRRPSTLFKVTPFFLFPWQFSELASIFSVNSTISLYVICSGLTNRFCNTILFQPPKNVMKENVATLCVNKNTDPYHIIYLYNQPLRGNDTKV